MLNLTKISAANASWLKYQLPHLQQLLPFYREHSQSRRAFFRQLAAGSEFVIRGLLIEKRIQAVFVFRVEETQAELVNWLLLPETSLATGIRQLTRVVRELALQELRFSCLALNGALNQALVQAGYQVEITRQGDLVGKQTFEVTKGLVLAGGGARGAYQIGAWRALRERGLSFPLITGTSVGALNGALILQGDFAVAEALWNHIQTDQVLNYPHDETLPEVTFAGVLKEVGHFAKAALQQQGVDTSPLRRVILTLLDAAKLSASQQELYFCTTDALGLKEVVLEARQLEVAEFAQWLLASASFYPAMAATKIGDRYYVDGGYRNNIPIDVALAKGAQQLLVLDVKGPGITKPVDVPMDVPVTTVASKWSLGPVLLFEGERSRRNQQLGYWEMQKSLGGYTGDWYTLQGEFSEPDFLHGVKQHLTAFKQSFSEGERNLWRRALSDLSLERELPSEVSAYVALLELAAKFVGVSPLRAYDLTTFVAYIGHAELAATPATSEAELVRTLSEWTEVFLAQTPLPGDHQQISYFLSVATAALTSKKNQQLLQLAPVNYLISRLIKHLHL